MPTNSGSLCCPTIALLHLPLDVSAMLEATMMRGPVRTVKSGFTG